MDLYHGSPVVVKKPIYGYGKKNNDYGQGFYLTENEEIAKEWAVTPDRGGVVNHYSLDINGLKVLYLNRGNYNVLNWLAILIENRKVNLHDEISQVGAKYIVEHYSIDYKSYDVIVGYRADDSYFSFTRAFLSNAITVGQLKRVMKLGKLGEQVVLISEKAFDSIEFIDSEEVSRSLYFAKQLERNIRATTEYNNLIRELDLGGLRVVDLIKEGVKNNDERLF
ncbi:MAG: DUF3990 domain-containing protein [Bacilli bacterium]|nr:DUF3990 domain-containing protein [Bacilli bacterium]